MKETFVVIICLLVTYSFPHTRKEFSLEGITNEKRYTYINLNEIYPYLAAIILQ